MDYLFIKQSLGIKEIVQILENPPEKCITIPPRKPKAGQVFLFRGEDPTKEGNNTNATRNRITHNLTTIRIKPLMQIIMQ